MKWILLACLCLTGCASRHPVVAAASRMPAATFTYTPPDSAHLGEPLRLLYVQLTVLGVTVERKPPAELNGAWGRTLQEARAIQIRDNLSVDAEFEVLVHEAAHVFQPYRLSVSAKEVFAELVLWEVCQRYDVDVTDRIAAYLTGHKEALAVAPVLQADIDLVVDLLLDGQ